jgi:hypothetical protein
MGINDELKRASHEFKHQMNLKGKDTKLCTVCRGRGCTESAGEDEYGCYKSPPPCRACGGLGILEFACAPVDRVIAIKAEIARLQKELKELKKTKNNSRIE